MIRGIVILLISIQAVLAAPPSRQRLLMDFNWKFSQTDTIGAEHPGFNDASWRTLDLPHDWSIESEFIESAPTTGRGGYLPTGIGWYRKHFTIPKSITLKSTWIEFDGVYQNSDVWINDHHLGHYPGGYVSFYYDVTPWLRAGENVLTVRVDNSKQPNSRWYSGSGIYRHVWLTVCDPLHVAPWGIFVTTPVADADMAEIAIEANIENKNKSASNASIRCAVFDPAGKEVARVETPFLLVANGQSKTALKLKVGSPVRWTIENPALYTLKSQLVEKGKVVDEVSTTFGIRKIEFDEKKGFQLNGKQVKMNGVCLHHDAGSVGAAVPEAMWVRRLKLLKEMGCNAIRTSHNPYAPEFLDLCDKMGFLVQDEIFDEWTSAKVEHGYHEYFEKWSQHDVTNFVRRDRNHPSIVMWSAGNEIGEQKMENGPQILKPLLDKFHQEDPTRPVTTGNDNIAADNGSTTLPFMQMLDIVGYNYVDRWHERREIYNSEDHHNHPDWKMIGTESVSIPGVRGNYFGGRFGRVDSSLVSPAYLPAVIRAEQLWKFVSSHDYMMGDFMWTGIDYLGESRWPDKNASSGVIDLCGFPKDGYYFYQSQWTDKPMIHLAPHWNWPGREGKTIPVLVYTNCDTVELFLNGKSLGMKSLEFPRQGNSGGWNKYDHTPVNITTGDLHLMWDVQYAAGSLKAVGRKEGKRMEEEIVTAGPVAALRVSADRIEITAANRDVTHIRIEMTDAQGHFVPDANNQVQVSVSGPGKLIGLDNGNPRDHTSMKSNNRKVFNGLALGVIQTTGQAGTIHITISSPGLKAVTLDLVSKQAAPAYSRVEDLK